MKIKPLFDRVVIKPIKDKSSKSVAGLVLPESVQERPLLAEVIEVGPGNEVDGKLLTMVVKPKQKVLYSKYASVSYKIDDKEIVIIRQTDILAIVD